MKLSTEGLTLGTIARLEAKGYRVVLEDGGAFADVVLEAPSTPSVGVPDREGWSSLVEYTE